MPLDVGRLYQDPYLEEVKKIDSTDLSLQQFSLQLKSIVLQQQNAVHKAQYQTLKEMKLSCLQLKQQLQILKQHVQLYNSTVELQQAAQSNNQEIHRLRLEINKIQMEPEDMHSLLNFTLLYHQDSIQQQTMSQGKCNGDSTKLDGSNNVQASKQSLNRSISEYTEEQQFKYQFLLKQQFNNTQLDAQVESFIQKFCISPIDVQESMLLHIYVLDIQFAEYQGTLNLGGYLYNYIQQVNNKLLPLVFFQLKKQPNKRLLAMLQLFNSMKYKQIVLQTVAQTSQSVSQQLAQAKNIYELLYNLYSAYQYYREQFIETFPHKNEIDVLFSTILSQEFKPKFNIMLTRLTFNESKENIFINQILEYIDNYQKIQCVLEFFRQIENKQLKCNQQPQLAQDTTADALSVGNKSNQQLYSDKLIILFNKYLHQQVPKRFQEVFEAQKPKLLTNFRQLDVVSQEEGLIQDMAASLTKQLTSKLFECSSSDYFYNVQVVSQLLSYTQKSVDGAISILQQQYFDCLCDYTHTITFTDNSPLANDKMFNVLGIYECATQYHEECRFKEEVKQMIVRYLTNLSSLMVKNKQTVKHYQQEFEALKQSNVTWEEASSIFNKINVNYASETEKIKVEQAQ